jgi:hypothetical protein
MNLAFALAFTALVGVSWEREMQGNNPSRMFMYV